MRQADNMIYGKIPPQARDFEDAALGTILMENSAFDIAFEIVKPESFYVTANQILFACMCSMNRKGMVMDIRTVAEELKKSEQLEAIGGAHHLVELTNSVTSGTHMTHYCRVIFERFMKREIIRMGGEMVGNAYEDSTDAFELMDQVEKNITELALQRVSKNIPGIDGLMIDRFQRINELRKNESHITGVPSGFNSIDKITHGWQSTDLIILAARPSVGKTAFAVQLARNAAMSRKPIPVAIFSLEMSAGQLTDRILSAESGIYLDKISNGMMEEGNMKALYEQGLQPLAAAKIFIDDTPALNIYELRSKARRLKRKENIGMVVIDYLQLMSGQTDSRTNREQEISIISRSLKALSKELNVPIIALSQLSREPEKRKGDLKTPQLSDLRESGAIEQDADLVMTMYRPEYYDEASNEMGESTKGETHLSILKHRNGRLAKGKETIKLRADLSIQKFFEMEEETTAFLGPGKWKPVSGGHNQDNPF